MISLLNVQLSDRCEESFIVVAIAATLLSTTGLVISRRASGRAPFRHLVSLAALVGCLLAPCMVLVVAATDLSLLSIPAKKNLQVAPVAEVKPWYLAPPRAVLQGVPDPDSATTTSQWERIQASDNATILVLRDVPGMKSHQLDSTAPWRSIAPAELRTGAAAAPFATIAVLVWSAGAVMMLVRLVWNCARGVRLRRQSHRIEDRRLRALLDEVAEKIGFDQAPVLLASTRVTTPIAMGLGRPAVLMPETLLGAISDDEMRDVLMHEAAHLQRGDQHVVLLESLAAAVYWPVVPLHMLSRELQRAREEICDNVVLASRSEIAYGETLLRVAELLAPSRPASVGLSLFPRRGQLAERISGLIDPSRDHATKNSRSVTFSILLAFLTATAIVSTLRLASAGEERPNVLPEVHGFRPLLSLPNGLPASRSVSDESLHAGVFTGRVNGPDGKPFGHARIYMVPVASHHVSQESLGPLRAVSSDDGRFRFLAPDMTFVSSDGLPARRTGIIVAVSDEFGPAWMYTWGANHSLVRPKARVDKNAPIQLELGPADVPIRGRFLDPNGKPLSGARVRLTGLVAPRNQSLDGVIDQVKDPGAIWVSPNNEGQLLHPQAIPGLVTETRTDGQGNFTLAGLGGDRIARLTVSAPGVVETQLRVMTRIAADALGHSGADGKPARSLYGANFELRLAPGLTVRGRVIDRNTGEPIAGMRVSAPPHTSGSDSKQDERGAETDSSGRFALTGLPPGVMQQEEEYRQIQAFSPPGLPYQTAIATMERANVEEGAELLIECTQGIPFRLRVTDEQGEMVDADVVIDVVRPNSEVDSSVLVRGPISRAARVGPGTYRGFVSPGPGAVFVNVLGRSYRPAHVDPKTFFAAGRTDWTPQETIDAYGTDHTVSTIGGGLRYQSDYEAIVLTRPSPDSGPLELTAKLAQDIPRRVFLVDMDGKPVVNVQTEGMTYFPWDAEPRLRVATFPLSRLHPDRSRLIRFVQKERQLIGEIQVGGDSDQSITVRMQRWSTVTGRIVDGSGSPLVNAAVQVQDAPFFCGAMTDSQGRFRVDQLAPGKEYDARIYCHGRRYASASERLVLQPGEERNLGVIETAPLAKANALWSAAALE